MAATAIPAAITVACRECGATLEFAPELRTARCPYCASTSIVERPPSRDRPRPTFVVGFVLDKEHAEDALRRWTRSRWFAHSGYARAAIDAMRGVYVPTYLYGAVAHAAWSASIGEDYTETETYTTTENGHSVTHTRTVTKTEWRDLSGEHACYLTDVVVTASRGVPNEELEAIEPFDLRALRRYDPAMLSGWIAEEPSRTLEECIAFAHDEAVRGIDEMLGRFMPGDSHRDLRFVPRLENQVVDLLLLPLWSFAVRYAPGKPPVRVLVNGQTGKAHGKVPRSFWKITGTIALGLGLLALLAWSLGLFSG